MPIQGWLPVIISSTGIIIAFCAFIWQIHRARFNQSVDLLFRLENDFFGLSKRLQRVKAATGLKNGDALEAEPILDFFETMALLVRRGALDQEMVWHTFFYWIDRYYQAAIAHIQLRQQDDPLVWKDLSSFVARLRGFQVSNAGSASYHPPTPDQVAEFLTEEQTEAI